MRDSTINKARRRLRAKVSGSRIGRAALRHLKSIRVALGSEEGGPATLEGEYLQAVRSGVEAQKPRLNIILVAISEHTLFGGTTTAIRLLRHLSGSFEEIRIIVMFEDRATGSAQNFFSQWPSKTIGEPDVQASHVLFSGANLMGSVPIRANDVFIATTWYTAEIEFRWLKWQEETFGVSGRKLLYLIQDFEPGFYPWSSRYVLADSTYRHPSKTLAVINSKSLAEHFSGSGYTFENSIVLAPRLNPKLRFIRETKTSFRKIRQILVYGRPGVDRNAYEVLVAGLSRWCATYEPSRNWNLVAAGEAFDTVAMPNGNRLRSLGKLTLEAYGDVLEQSAIGISLMVSPHPSYPPLEMAAFGARVITNDFLNKRMSQISSFIIGIPHLTLDSLVSTLTRQCEYFDREAGVQTFEVSPSAIDWNNEFLDGQDEFSAIRAGDVTDHLMGQSL